MTEGRMIKGLEVHESPVPGKLNKFVITEDRAWFLAMEDESQLFHADILRELFRFSNQEEEELFADKFDDERNMMGTVAKETGEETVYGWSPADGNSEVVKRRMREIFPRAEYFVGADGERHPL